MLHAILSFILLAVVVRAVNTTIPDQSSEITYSSTNATTWRYAEACRYINGTVAGSQPGCYNVPDKCTDTMHVSYVLGASATLKFQGTGISYIGTTSRAGSGIITVTVDGQSEDIDSATDAGPFVCRTFYSKTGLSPLTEHTISVELKGPSSNGTGDAYQPLLSIAKFIVESEAGGSSSTVVSGSSTMSPFSSSTSPAALSATTSSATASTPSPSLNAGLKLESTGGGVIAIVALWALL